MFTVIPDFPALLVSRKIIGKYHGILLRIIFKQKPHGCCLQDLVPLLLQCQFIIDLLQLPDLGFALLFYRNIRNHGQINGILPNVVFKRLSLDLKPADLPILAIASYDIINRPALRCILRDTGKKACCILR